MAPKVTPLIEQHRALGARFIEFAGWLMPVQYEGIVAEHLAVRSRAGLFDLGHMGQLAVRGRDALPFLQFVTPNDVGSLKPGRAQYSMLLYPNGGVVDDIMIYLRPDREEYLVVVNAANTDKDFQWLLERRADHPEWVVELEDISATTGMLAIQGPRAERILQRVTEGDLSTIRPFDTVQTTVTGVPTLVARTGYTGEDGFELYFPIEATVRLWDRLLEIGRADGLVPVGLGARDTLRLEACLPLYGNELSPEITPLEAQLGWVVKFHKGSFIGREALERQLQEGVPRKLVGFELVERSGIPRHGYEVQLAGRRIGTVTSGTSSPSLGKAIGLALIESSAAGIGREFDVVIRGKPVRARQVKTPFYRRPRQRIGEGIES
ncbi:glycine cleavage system aminomethyltransferase GcvT [Thermomicrobium sp. CFH 73360]|uniref:glycine cleavage system aminomethyltransferase GcvT n=1 Tax=Thermomicrobium sp. CFH 73360 TaxID=2951987 RepID=UPI0020778E73|nr:glycine cleavage system aminomethyltransferase GcvT [Thermomicrobium sp. CFH 73360]